MIPFTKMHGLGNDYVYIDAGRHVIDDPPALARAIADRHCGVGGDGLILVLPPAPGVAADVRMRMFNADGSEAEMCGNGIRCVCKFAHDEKISTAAPMRVQTEAGVLTLAYTLDASGRVDRVTVDMGEPELSAQRIPVQFFDGDRIVGAPIERVMDKPERLLDETDASGLEPRMTCVSMGNPHAVLFCSDVARVPLAQIGPMIETAPVFPNRINVHFVQVHDRNELTMRTWERGSGITQACGTGAAAVCVAAVLTDRTDRRILAHLPGGDLTLAYDASTNRVAKTGPARTVFKGHWPT